MAQGPEQQGWQPQPQGWGGPSGGQPPQQPFDEQGNPSGQPPQQGPQGQPGTPPPWTPPPFQGPPGQYPPQGGGQFPPGGQFPQGQYPPQGGQFPPGGQFPQGVPPQGGFPGAYPPPRSGRKPLVALFSAIGAVIVVLAVVAIAVWTGGDEPAKPLTAEQKRAAAAEFLSGVRGLRYTGDFTSDTTPVQADLSVTHAGTATGTLTVYGQSMDMMLLDGDMYVKAPKAFWVTQPEAGEQVAPDYADKWAKAPKSLRGFDIRALLVPGALGQSLGQAAPTVVPSGQPTAQAAAGGVPSLSFEGGDAQYLVSDKAPHRLTHVKTGGDDSFSFTVTEVDTAALSALYDGVLDKVKNELIGALDPYSPISRSGLSSANGCTESKCDVEQSFVNDGATAWVKYHAEVSTDKAGTKPIGECTKSVKITKGKTALKCSVAGAAWKKWVRSLDGGSGDFYSYGWVQVESVSGARAATIVSEIEKERG
ncbi:hypothetical protein EDD29_7997 [Actinocorallia herbida]|uniref:Uncharacterized protein n=1 Tax=Actinocorallia herbida TaxID=58109 RepID=A0A3N1D9S0_9ACTN|nr:hypothetical protein [Actinocorallia herbida]ROO90275.1 hypothetical protein EDD29_7997 [Actinocorallia herbida]